jgi:hypothetical protein
MHAEKKLPRSVYEREAPNPIEFDGIEKTPERTGMAAASWVVLNGYGSDGEGSIGDAAGGAPGGVKLKQGSGRFWRGL